MRQNIDQNNIKYGHFLRSEMYHTRIARSSNISENTLL